MKLTKKAAIQARIDRLNQPEMMERYREMAITETERHFELIDEDWLELNGLWSEKRDTPNFVKPCAKCGGI